MRKKLLAIGFGVVVAIFFFWVWLSFHYSVPILMYHSFDKNLVGKYAAVSLETFSKQMDFIKRRGYRVVPLDEYCRIVREKKEVPHNLVVITSDDGYKDNVVAIKILKEFDFPATIFLIVDRIGQEGHVSKEDVRWLLENTSVRIGSHTVSHVYLPEAEDDVLKEQIDISKEVLENMFSAEIDTIAYPIGGFDRRVLKEVERSGYQCGCTTNRGFSRKRDIFALRRIKITERDLGLRLWAKLSGFYNVFKRVKNPY